MSAPPTLNELHCQARHTSSSDPILRRAPRRSVHKYARVDGCQSGCKAPQHKQSLSVLRHGAECPYASACGQLHCKA